MKEIKIERKCKTCNHRGIDKLCHSPFICNVYNCLSDKINDSLVYCSDTSGVFKAGDNFCCIHWERK